ncbi:MAG: hypothetical protein AAGJ18_16780 [Bacteroidota bacterium]
MKNERLDCKSVCSRQYAVGSRQGNHKIFGALRFCLALLILSTVTLTAQIEKSKTVEKTFDLGKDGTVRVDHRYGLLKVTKSNDGKVHLTSRMRVEGSDEGGVELALGQFETDINEFGNTVTIETALGIKNWSSTNGRIRLQFKNGAKAKGLKKLVVEMLLAVPALAELELKNKYEDIIIDHDFEGDLQVVMYDGDVRTKKVAGELEMEIKYGKAFFGAVQDADLTLYDAELEMENGGDVKIASKYSEFTIGDTKSLKIRAYDDKMELGNIAGIFQLSDKYSEVKMGSFSSGRIDMHDGDLVARKGGELLIEGSKYSKFRFESLDKLNIDDSHDDKFVVRKAGDVSVGRTKYTEYELGTMKGNLSVSSSHDDKFVMDAVADLSVNETKYTEYEIGTLTGKIDLLDSHDDKVEVRTVATSFKGLKVGGKYTKVNMSVPSSVKYALEAEMTYGNIDYPESNFDSQYYKEKGSVLQVRGTIKGAGADAPKIEVVGHDCKVDLN